jgi:hypothetical protein
VLDAGKQTVKVAVVGDLHPPPYLAQWMRLPLPNLTNPLFRPRLARSRRRREQQIRHLRRSPEKPPLFRLRRPPLGSPCSAASDAPHLAVDRAPR